MSFIALLSNFAITLRGLEGIKTTIKILNFKSVLLHALVAYSGVFGKDSCVYVIPFALHRRDVFHNADHADTFIARRFEVVVFPNVFRTVSQFRVEFLLDAPLSSLRRTLKFIRG